MLPRRMARLCAADFTCCPLSCPYYTKSDGIAGKVFIDFECIRPWRVPLPRAAGPGASCARSMGKTILSCGQGLPYQRRRDAAATSCSPPNRNGQAARSTRRDGETPPLHRWTDITGSPVANARILKSSGCCQFILQYWHRRDNHLRCFQLHKAESRRSTSRLYVRKARP